ncbi:prepilin peptidase [Candidatus Bathyarchaeota archaeon]|nr:prepilin peptidase [Candidatus Bathyarchaeota archaeon]MBS7631065.1 prepilin peptidase [Candidatus Bathyarchaeota archaeon]
MSSLIVLDLLRFLLSLTVLTYASWRDVKTREIPDKIWILFSAPAIGMDFYELYIGRIDIIQFFLAIAFSFIISFSLAYFELFGGADFKAFVVLSLLQPIQPRFIEPVLKAVSVIYPLTVFADSAIAGACIAIVTLVKNITSAYTKGGLFEKDLKASLARKLLIMVSGVKMDINEVRGPPFEYPLEKIEGNVRKLTFMPRLLRDEEALEAIKELKEAGFKEIWVSRTLPFLVFITIGFILSIFLGDIILWVIQLILIPK